MKPVRCLLVLLLVACASVGAAQSVTVQIMTDAAIPADFGTSYGLGQLSNSGFTYGPNFLIQVSYSNLAGHSLSFALSGGQADYELAWRVAGTTQNNPLSEGLGLAVTGLSGSESGAYYRENGTLVLLAGDGTRYRIGARSTPAASVDLSTQITLTATLQ